jgi:signal transduction histidine kinase
VSLSQLDSAVFYNEMAMEKFYTNNQKNDFWMPYFNLYSIFKALKKRDKALEYLKQAYLYTNPKVRMDKGYVLYTLIMELHKEKDKKELDKYLNEYINFKRAGGPESMSAEHLGLDELIKGDTSYARILEEKIKKVKAAPVSFALKDFYFNLAQIYFDRGDIDKAELTLGDAESQIEKNDKDINLLYFKIFKAKNDLNKALLYLEEYVILQDSVYQKSFENTLAEFEARYQTQQIENELTKQKAQNAENKLKLRTSYGLIGGLLLLSGFAFIFYKNRLKHQSLMNAKEQELHSERIKQLEQENKVLALNAMIEGQEAERLRIAQDLHDGLGGLLTTVKAHFNSIEKEINAIKNLNVYDKTNDLIDKACIEVRRIAHNMVPHSIQISGLHGAMSDLKNSIESQGLTCELDMYHMDEVNLSQEKLSMIYRVIQEISNNTIKHANASHLFIQLMKMDDSLHIIVEDNGKGFDINEVVTKKGLGLKSIDSRVKFLNGTIHYDSSPNHGTTVNIEIPLSI